MGKTVPDQIPGQSFCCLYDASETTFRWAGIDRIIQPNRPHDEAASYYSMTGHRAVVSQFFILSLPETMINTTQNESDRFDYFFREDRFLF